MSAAVRAYYGSSPGAVQIEDPPTPEARLQLPRGPGLQPAEECADVACSRESSPKLQVVNTALMTVPAGECAVYGWRERAPQAHSETAAFAAACKLKRTLPAGGDGIVVEDLLSRSVAQWLAP